MFCFTAGYSTICLWALFYAWPITVVLKCGWQIAQNCVNRIKVTEIHSHTKTASHTSCLYRWEAQLSAVCSIKMRRIPCDVLITSSRSSPGSTNASPSSLMLDRADAAWNEMSGWPRYDRETDNTEVLCPVGMGVITDNIISSCGLLGLLYFFHTLPQSIKVCCCSSVTFFNLLHSCPRTNTMQILYDILYMLRLKYSMQEYAMSHSFLSW